MKIVVIGSNGQLGSEICFVFEEKDIKIDKLNHDSVDVSDFDSVKSILKKIEANVVINTAAMHNVEACEANPIASFAVNGCGARNLALLSKEFDFVLVHISTDYVFDGAKNAPYTELDSPLPLNVYGIMEWCGFP